MAWEWNIVFRIFNWSLLRREDFAWQPGMKRWGIGHRTPYLAMDGNTYMSWSCWKELA